MKIWTLIVGLGVMGCTTTQTSDLDETKVVSPAFYTLREGGIAENKLPLPNLTKIFVNWTYSDGGKTSHEGFRGWDVDHDGKFDMLEALDADGKPYMWAFDFDGNGVIDAVTGGPTKGSVSHDSQAVITPSEVAH